MLKVIKYKTIKGYDYFEIETNQGKFQISLQGNLDLYWRYLYNNKNVEKETEKDFYITKENYYIYSIFDELYNSIKENKPWFNYPYDNEEKNKIIEENIYPLFKDNKIIFISDDGFVEDGSKFIIEKEDKHTYKLTFKKGKDSSLSIPTFAIRISNNGSRYEPFNMTFMNMYHKLKEYDTNNHQIHIEEYLYNEKKLIKKK